MSEESTLTKLVRAFSDAVLPLAQAVSSDGRFSGLASELGWESTGVPGPIAELGQPLTALASVAGDGAISVDDLDDVLAALTDVIDAIEGLRTADPAEFDPVLIGDGFLDTFPSQLIDYLLLDYLDAKQPELANLLGAAGIVRTTYIEGAGARPDYLERRLEWSAFAGFLSDPAGVVQTALGWGTSEFDFDQLSEHVADLAGAIGLAVGLEELQEPMLGVLESGADLEDEAVRWALHFPVRSAGAEPATDAGVMLYLLPPANEHLPGLAILPYAASEFGAGLDLSDTFRLAITTSIDLTSGVAILLRPNEPIEVLSGVESGSPVSGGEVRAEFTFTGSTTQRTLLLGSSEGTRLEAAGVSFAAGADPANGGDLFLEAQLEGGQLVVSGADAGAFMAMLLGDADRTVAMAPVFGFSTARGAYLRGGSDLSWLLPLRLVLGPITIEDITVAILPDGDTISIDVGAAIATVIGPFSVLVDKMGVSGEFRFLGAGGNLGPLDASVEFLPPTALLFAIETEAVSGGGFIYIDTELGRYSGGLALDILGIGINAIVIIDTEVPGSGWALFASIGATFASPIPIGFGFTLIGVGGLIAVNRTIDIDALAPALKTGAADAILFPENILDDATTVLNGLDDWFPTQNATTVFGPVVEIGWGNPTLISAQLGIVIALPDLIITLLGSIEMLLPTPDEAILSLRMDILGAVDIPAAEVTVAASLHNSNLLGIYELSGDMGFFARLSGQPLFLLSVGGYHPQFDPPGAIPGWLLDLRRTRAAVPLGVAVEVVLSSYVAITSNSVQLGGRFQLIASVKVLLTTYTAKGWFTIHLLLVLKPFKFSARASAGVSITAGEKELFGVQLSARLEGPQEWFASGSAYFNFFGFDVEFGFEIGDKVGGEPRELKDVGKDVVDAMTPTESWKATIIDDTWASGVVMADKLPAGLWVRPDQSLEVAQSLAPLNRTITAYGELTPTQNRIDADEVTLGGLAVDEPDWIEDWFAPAQFDRLDDTASLASPSYELMTGGVRFGDSDVSISADTSTECTTVSREPEESIYPDSNTWLSTFVSPAQVSTAPSAHRTVTGTTLAMEPNTYTVVRTVNGTRADSALHQAGLGRKLTYADAVRVIDERAADDAAERSHLRVAPSYAAME